VGHLGASKWAISKHRNHPLSSISFLSIIFYFLTSPPRQNSPLDRCFPPERDYRGPRRPLLAQAISCSGHRDKSEQLIVDFKRPAINLTKPGSARKARQQKIPTSRSLSAALKTPATTLDAYKKAVVEMEFFRVARDPGWRKVRTLRAAPLVRSRHGPQARTGAKSGP
jgi:hypothetical protein